MGLLKDASSRLLREDKWDSADELAQEIYAILQSDGPLTLDGPVTIINTGDTPALVVQQQGSNLPSIVVQRGSDPFSYEVPVLMPPDVSKGSSSSQVIRYVLVKKVKGDTVVVDDPNDTSFRGVVAAKPYYLRGSSPLDQTWAHAFLLENLIDSCQVQAYSFNPVEPENRLTRRVAPPYVLDAPIAIIAVSSAVVSTGSTELTAAANVLWLDAGLDGRGWASDGSPDALDSTTYVRELLEAGG